MRALNIDEVVIASGFVECPFASYRRRKASVLIVESIFAFVITVALNIVLVN